MAVLAKEKRRVAREEIGKILKAHSTWRNSDHKDGKQAHLENVDLRGMDLHGAWISSAELQGADLRDSNLEEAYLHNASVRGAQLAGADLRQLDATGAFLINADLYDANLYRLIGNREQVNRLIFPPRHIGLITLRFIGNRR